MPKSHQKAQPKKVKPKKTKLETQPKQVSITSSKYYWLTLTLVMVVFGSVYGYMMKVAAAALGLLLASVLFIIAFAYYLRFKPSTLKTSVRATFVFVGACVIGFCIWAAVVLLSFATGLSVQITDSMGEGFFSITSMIICLVTGAFIGDLIGNNKEQISIFLKNKLSR